MRRREEDAAEKVRKAHVAYLVAMIYTISVYSDGFMMELYFPFRKCLGCKRLRHFLFVKKFLSKMVIFLSEMRPYI